MAGIAKSIIGKFVAPTGIKTARQGLSGGTRIQGKTGGLADKAVKAALQKKPGVSALAKHGFALVASRQATQLAKPAVWRPARTLSAAATGGSTMHALQQAQAKALVIHDKVQFARGNALPALRELPKLAFFMQRKAQESGEQFHAVAARCCEKQDLGGPKAVTAKGQAVLDAVDSPDPHKAGAAREAAKPLLKDFADALSAVPALKRSTNIKVVDHMLGAAAQVAQSLKEIGALTDNAAATKLGDAILRSVAQADELLEAARQGPLTDGQTRTLYRLLDSGFAGKDGKVPEGKPAKGLSGMLADASRGLFPNKELLPAQLTSGMRYAARISARALGQPDSAALAFMRDYLKTGQLLGQTFHQRVNEKLKPVADPSAPVRHGLSSGTQVRETAPTVTEVLKDVSESAQRTNPAVNARIDSAAASKL